MTQIILIFIISATIGFLVAWFWFNKRERELQREAKMEMGRVEKEIQKEREMWYGFSEYNERVAALKAARKAKIMEKLKGGGNMHTGQVADLLDISRATAFRYLEELEKEGLIAQVGAQGKDVQYRAK